MTPFERDWGVTGGVPLRVFDTALGKIAVLICYDSEFPLLARAVAEAGAEIILVPSCTESVSGYHRVRTGTGGPRAREHARDRPEPDRGRCAMVPGRRLQRRARPAFSCCPSMASAMTAPSLQARSMPRNGSRPPSISRSCIACARQARCATSPTGRPSRAQSRSSRASRSCRWSEPRALPRLARVRLYFSRHVIRNTCLQRLGAAFDGHEIGLGRGSTWPSAAAPDSSPPRRSRRPRRRRLPPPSPKARRGGARSRQPPCAPSSFSISALLDLEGETVHLIGAEASRAYRAGRREISRSRTRISTWFETR